jgi:hypothetical protein
MQPIKDSLVRLHIEVKVRDIDAHAEETRDEKAREDDANDADREVVVAKVDFIIII